MTAARRLEDQQAAGEMEHVKSMIRRGCVFGLTLRDVIQETTRKRYEAITNLKLLSLALLKEIGEYAGENETFVLA
jgi:hypothetical protein